MGPLPAANWASGNLPTCEPADRQRSSAKLYADDVGEWTRRFQCIIRQERVEPQYVHYLGTMRVQTDALTPWQRLLDASRGLSRQQSEDVFRRIRDAMNRERV
jgi:hypothetical protein